MPACPDCSDEPMVKNGHIHNGRQRHVCRGCGRQFVLDPQFRKIDDETRGLSDRLLLERVSMEGICRVTGVSSIWLE